MTKSLIFVLLMYTGEPARGLVQSDPIIRPFNCETFGPDSSAIELAQRFGATNLSSTEINIGEGETAPGTVVFPNDPLDRIEILWKDKQEHRRPHWVRLTGERSHWRTPDGITLGTRLNSVRATNGRSFNVLSFDRDNGGTVLSWNGGHLEQTNAVCTLNVAFAVDPRQSLRSLAAARRLQGGSYSSDRRAMRELNPRVYELILAWD